MRVCVPARIWKERSKRKLYMEICILQSHRREKKQEKDGREGTLG